MDWLKDSIMMTKGVGKNSDGETHHLTEKVQGTYQYTMGPYSCLLYTSDAADE